MTPAERIAGCLRAAGARITPDIVAAITAAGSVEEVAAAFHAYAAERMATALQKRELEQALHADGWSRRTAKAEASRRLNALPVAHW